jgi:hypothetical protein
MAAKEQWHSMLQQDLQWMEGYNSSRNRGSSQLLNVITLLCNISSWLCRHPALRAMP